jgi:hypothetical protein
MASANDALVAKLLTASTQVERIADIPVSSSQLLDVVIVDGHLWDIE